MSTYADPPIDLPPPIAADASGPAVTVTARVTGDFPASPVDLRYHFTLEGATIAGLEITA